jgi:hypothetical protein
MSHARLGGTSGIWENPTDAEAVDRGLKLAVAGKGWEVHHRRRACTLLARRGGRCWRWTPTPTPTSPARSAFPPKGSAISSPYHGTGSSSKRTGARVGRYGQLFKMNPEVSDIAAVTPTS